MRKIFIMSALGLSTMLTFSGSGLASTKPSPSPKAKVVAVAPKAPEVPQPKLHKVVAGDSLSSIATAENLDSWRPLWNVNPEIADPDLIYADEQLVVPTAPTTDRALPEVVAAAPRTVSTGVVHSAAALADYSAGVGGLMARIRQHESGGNYATNTGNGYYGAYQYDLGTWANYGGYARADLAPAAVQDAKALATYAARGCSPWPNTCY
jgi:LysM repeat protein